MLAVDSDYLLAVELQRQFDSEYAAGLAAVSDQLEAADVNQPPAVFSADGERSTAGRSDRGDRGAAPAAGGSSVPPRSSSSLTDTMWEMIDPTPDALALFVEFNERYFWNKLNGVEVRWSKRMTL